MLLWQFEHCTPVTGMCGGVVSPSAVLPLWQFEQLVSVALCVNAAPPQLVKPLAEGTLAGRVRCSFESISGEAATHGALEGVLGRKDYTAPALLFTASWHGCCGGSPPADGGIVQQPLIRVSVFE